MRHYIVFGFLLCFVASGCANTLTSNTRTAPAATGTPDNEYGGIVMDFSDFLVIPGKYACGRYTVTPPSADAPVGQTVILSPRNIALFKTSGRNSGIGYDATFSDDCTRLFYVDKDDPPLELHAVDTASGRGSTLTISKSAIPSGLILTLGDNPPTTYYPVLDWLYGINHDHLLVSFNNPTTGRDASTNQTSQAIYNVATHALTFISIGGDVPPVLLNYRTNALILPRTDRGGVIAQRIEIDLTTGNQTITDLKTPYQYTLPCDENTFATRVEYVACNQRWLSKLLQ